MELSLTTKKTSCVSKSIKRQTRRYQIKRDVHFDGIVHDESTTAINKNVIVLRSSASSSPEALHHVRDFTPHSLT